MNIQFRTLCTAIIKAKSILLLAVPLLWSIHVSAETPQELCDRLAGDPAAKLEEIDAGAAVSACSAALAASPQTPRLAYEYARALERMGRVNQARDMYQWAVNAGMQEAVAALTRLSKQQKGKTAASNSTERKQYASRLEGAGAIAKNVASSAPRDHEDAVALLAKTGTDPSSILKWVQSNTRLIPYAGMLRDASGVLMDRAGNSLDRALLVGDLLRRAGQTVRVARATLSPDTVAASRASFIASLPDPKPHAIMDRAEQLRVMGNDPRLDHAILEKSVDETIINAERFDADVKDLFSHVYSGVERSLAHTTIWNKQLTEEIDAVFADHFWVQRRVANGWEDLDPDEQIVHKVPAATTFGLNEVPENLKQLVTLRIMLETWNSGKLSESKILEKRWTPSELAGKSVTLSHSFFPLPPITQFTQESDPQKAYLDALVKAWVVSPEIQVGSDTVKDQLYTMDGRVLPSSISTLASLGVGGIANFGKLQSGLNAAFGGAPEKSVSSEAPSKLIQVSAEWLEIEVSVPGHSSDKHRRAVFDLIGPAARAGASQVKMPEIDVQAKQKRALALSGVVDAFVFGSTPSADWLTRITGEALTEMAHKSAELVRSSSSLEDTLATESSNRLLLPLWGWALNRQNTGLLPESPPISPNVVLLWQTPTIKFNTKKSDTNGPAYLRSTIDIVSNSSVAGATFKQGVAQGLLDTVIEHMLLSKDSPGGNTAALFAIDIDAGHNWNVINPDHLDDLHNVALSEDAKALIRSDLMNGNLVLAPSTPISTAEGKQVAWWRINPKTGNTIGISETGGGADAVEEPTLLQKVAGKAVCAFVGLGLQIADWEFSFTSTFLMLACLGGKVSPNYGGIIAHGVADAVVDIFANKLAPSPIYGGGHGSHSGSSEH